MNNIISATTHYEITIQEPYKPIHIPSFEDTPENIDYCAKCPHDDCIYPTLELCKKNKSEAKNRYTKSEKWSQGNISKQSTTKIGLMPVAHAKHNRE